MPVSCRSLASSIMTDMPQKHERDYSDFEEIHVAFEKQGTAKHPLAAFAACFVSVVLHGALVYLLLTLPLGSLQDGVELLNQKIFRDVEIKADKSVQEDRLETASDGEVTGSIEAEVDAEELTGSDEKLDPKKADSAFDTEDSLAGPDELPEPSEWKPPREILAIEEKIVDDEVSALPRRLIPAIERIHQSDVSLRPVGRSDTVSEATDEAKLKPGKNLVPDTGPAAGPSKRNATGTSRRTGTEIAGDQFSEKPENVSEFKAVEDVLTAEATVFESDRESKYRYFKIDIQRAGKEALPLIPKDVVLVQDSSASLTERRLQFCKEGLKRSLPLIRQNDRFNVVSFSRKAEQCFTQWAQNTPENLRRATRFIESLHSGGNTDLYSSLKALAELERKPGRPAIAIVVTDGLPTSGITDSTEIIGKFSKFNDGTMSVFTLGAVSRANTYLLDILSYSNKGDVYVINRGRWEIPDAVKGLVRQVSRPVMADLSFRFAEGIRAEIYPVLSSDLYLDRPLTLYGRCPKNNSRIVFQAVGQGGDVKCDMIFDIDLSAARRTSEGNIRETWADQKIYHLLGRYARRRSSAALRELRETAESYNRRIPYGKRLH